MHPTCLIYITSIHLKQLVAKYWVFAQSYFCFILLLLGYLKNGYQGVKLYPGQCDPSGQCLSPVAVGQTAENKIPLQHNAGYLAGLGISTNGNCVDDSKLV